MGEVTRISLAAAQDQLTDLIRRALAGETIEITRDGQDAVRLTPVAATPEAEETAPTTKNPGSKSPGKRVPGGFPWLAPYADEFAKPLPDDEIDLWYK